jgi:soluble lytic murein transglycosylase-like protein
MSFELKPMGPEGVLARMQAIRARLGMNNAKPNPATGDQQAFTMPEDVSSWRSDRPSPLAGTITPEGTKPLSPFGPGMAAPTGNRRATFLPIIERAALAHGMDPKLLDAIVEAESDYNPNDVSRAGAKGLIQLMPETAAEVGVTDPFDPVQNVNGGAAYISKLMKRFPTLDLVLAAYNAGPGAVSRAGGIPPYKETQNYVKKVMRLYEDRKAGRVSG